MYVVVGYHGLDDQCIAVRVANMVCISITESDVICFPSELLGRSLVQRVNIGDQFVSSFQDIAILGSSRLSSEVWSAKDGPDFTRRSCLALVSA